MGIKKTSLKKSETPPSEESPVPRHVAIIPDGNRRWAKARKLPVIQGHRAGVDNFNAVLECLGGHGVECVTFYVFSTENWQRPRTEIRGLLAMLKDTIGTHARDLHRRNVRIRHLGSLETVPAAIAKALTAAVKLTAGNSGMTVNVAFNYGGRGEIVDAARKLAASGTPPEEIDEARFGNCLYDGGIPDVDLFIRTGGEQRLSNFLLWQASYSEFYFSDVLWPDFDREETEKALLAYRQRQRRFGGE